MPKIFAPVIRIRVKLALAAARYRALICLLIIVVLSTCANASQALKLQCEYRTNPLGIDAVRPELSWQIVSQTRDVHQTAYQILVSSTESKLDSNSADLWDSGKVLSSQSLYVKYAGKALKSRMRCFWKARVWDNRTGRSAWSEPGLWTMGLLTPSDWHAQWITPSKWFMPLGVRPLGLELGGAGGWADVDLGAALPIQQINLFANSPGSFPTRFKIEVADNSQFDNKTAIVDKSAQDYVATGREAQTFRVFGVAARYVRLEVLGTGQSTSVRQMQVISNGTNVALMRPTNEYNTDWSHGHAAFLVDGMPNNYDNDDCPADACPTVAAPMLRKEFAVHGRIVRAVLYNAALGMADVSINGHPVGNQVNGPPFSDYVKRVYYVTRDVTSLVRTGSNVIGAVLGNGFFSPPTGGFGDRLGGDGPPRFLSQLDITLADGTMQEIVTDPSWTWSRSEITFNDYWAGYMEDRTLAKPGWNTPDYAPDTTWQHVAETSALGGRLIAPLGPPVRVIAQVQPDRIVGNHAYFHVLTAGWPKITVAGHCGETVTINGINERLQFKLTQDGPTVLEPHFILTAGPLDLSVDGLTGSLAPGSVSLQCVAADLPRTGSFTSSNPFLNKVYQATLQTHLNYDVDFPADPTREKEGWTQDAQGFFDSAAYLTDVAGLYRRWWWDMADDQDPDGFVGSVLPVVGRHVYDWNSPWWSGVTVFIPWEHYLFYGDRRMLSEAYEPMRKYVDFLGLVAKSGIGERWDDYAYFNINQDPKAAATGMIMLNGAGDWLNPTTGSQFVVPAPMTTMPAYYYYATVVSRTAGLLGKTADEAKYAGLAADIKQRFNAAYFHTDSGLYGSETNNETAQVLPIAVGLVPDQYKNQAYQRLIDAIHARNDHVACGFVALPWLLQILTQNRETALVNKMVNQQDYPSWNSLMHDGILGEGWGGGGAQMPSTGGSIAMWMYQSTLGIRPDLTGPGFSRFILAPQPDTATGLTSASGYYDAAHGRIVSDWKQQDGQFFLRAVIPANTSATVTIPTNSLQSVLESGKPAAQQPGVKFVRSDADSVTYQVSSGEYHFVARVAVYVPPAALPITAKTSAGSCAAFEADLASKSLVALGQATCVSAVDSNDSGRSGSSNPDAIRNGTTLNGSGGPDTMNDGKTYRGYGSGSSLIFTLNTSLNPSGYDIDKIMTFAGHPDARASQSYAVSVSKVEAPQKFTTLILAAGAATSSGSSEIVIQTPTGGVISGGDTGRATGIAAVRFDFNDGPNGFNVYREIQIVGSPTKAVR